MPQVDAYGYDRQFCKKLYSQMKLVMCKNCIGFLCKNCIMCKNCIFKRRINLFFFIFFLSGAFKKLFLASFNLFLIF
jgi:hypothetical protein